MDLASLMTVEVMTKPVWMWAAFFGLVFALMALDLGVLHRKAHVIGVRESLMMSAFYVSLGLVFGGWIWWRLGPDDALLYWTGFVVEKSLAMDNVFVIALIFSYFAVPRALQHRVLFWGIIGVLILRGIMIGAGAAIVSEFEWVLLIFAAFLIWSGIKLLRSGDEETSLDDNKMIQFLKRKIRVTDKFHGDRFFVKAEHPSKGGLAWFATPLFLALVSVEVADVVFAVDSVPAIFAITTDPYIVFTSNVFAILGLRALFFTLAAGLDRLKYLKPALALLLVFIGGKVFAAELLGIEKIPPVVSLTVTFLILGVGVAASLWRTRRPEIEGRPQAEGLKEPEPAVTDVP